MKSPQLIPETAKIQNVLCVSLCSLQAIPTNSELSTSASICKSEEVEKTPSLCRKLQRDISFRSKSAYSVLVCASFMLLGWARGQLGPAFIDLQSITNVDLEKGSGFITSYYIGRMAGSLVGGILYDRFNKHLIFGFSVAFNALSFGVIPWCLFYELMIAAHLVNGASAGTLDVAVNASAMSLWGSKCRSFIQVLWVANTVASILAPIATAPFLMKQSKDIIRFSQTVPHSTLKHENVTLNFTQLSGNSSTVTYNAESKLYIAYSLSASIALAVAVPFFVWFCKTKKNHCSTETPETEGESLKFKINFIYDIPRVNQYIALFNAGFFAAIETAVDFTFSGFLPLFCVQYLMWTKMNGALLASAYFLCNLVGRLFGVFLVRIISSIKLLGICTLLSFVSYIGFTITAYIQYTHGVWASTCLLGLSVSILFPTFLSWTNRTVVPISGKVASYLVITSLIGALLNPLILTTLMVKLTALCFCYFLLGQCVLMIVSFLFMVSYTFQLKRLGIMSSKCSTDLMKNQN